MFIDSISVTFNGARADGEVSQLGVEGARVSRLDVGQKTARLFGNNRNTGGG